MSSALSTTAVAISTVLGAVACLHANLPLLAAGFVLNALAAAMVGYATATTNAKRGGDLS